ncbi:MAG: T9SS type A sorting domain-containing protein, partial [Saprospiraceae bacterium]
MEFVTGVAPSLTGSHQWYLLDKKATYTKPEDVLTKPLPLVVTLDSLIAVNPVVDFIAIKKGNISVDPGSFQEVEADSRSKVELVNDFKAYPNPFTDMVTFSINSETSNEAQLRIFNAAGMMIYTKDQVLTKGQNEVNVRLDNDITGLLLYTWTLGNQQFNGTLSRIK